MVNTKKSEYQTLGSLFKAPENFKSTLVGYLQVREEDRQAVADKILSGKKVHLSMFKNQPKKEGSKIKEYFTISLGKYQAEKYQ